MLFKQYPERTARHLISAPFIYMMIIPVVLLDMFGELYHHICFPLYGIPLVNRSQYIRIDRHRLSRLLVWEKVNCVYCGYVNGALAYYVRIAGETEKYWCGIKHHASGDFIQPPHHQGFEEYES